MAKPIMDSGLRGWTPDQLPDLAGRTYLITGANSGIGLEASKILVGAGGRVLAGSRDTARGEAAVSEINSASSGLGAAELVQIDLADQTSIRAAVEAVKTRADGLDAVINNAGVMQTPQRETKEGFELQFGTNHLGHFLLNGLLYDSVKRHSGRIVPVSSIVHRQGALDFDDLMLSGSYTPTKSYAQSKLANIVYGFELQRRLSDAGSPVSSIICHPGYSATSLQFKGPTGGYKLLYRVTNLFAQPAAKGAYSEALAAAGPEAKPGAYYGPTGIGDARGPVGDSSVADLALDEDLGRRLWDASEELLDFHWEI